MFSAAFGALSLSSYVSGMWRAFRTIAYSP